MAGRPFFTLGRCITVRPYFVEAAAHQLAPTGKPALDPGERLGVTAFFTGLAALAADRLPKIADNAAPTAGVAAPVHRAGLEQDDAVKSSRIDDCGSRSASCAAIVLSGEPARGGLGIVDRIG